MTKRRRQMTVAEASNSINMLPSVGKPSAAVLLPYFQAKSNEDSPADPMVNGQTQIAPMDDE